MGQDDKYTQIKVIEVEALKWWQSIAFDKAQRAMLRRAHSLEDVVQVPAFHRLYHPLKQHGPLSWKRAALIAGVLAHVDESLGGETDCLATQMGRPVRDGGRATISSLRFRRLLERKDEADLFRALVRVVRHLERKVSVASLVNDLYFWGDVKRRQWAFQYYDAAPATEK